MGKEYDETNEYDSPFSSSERPRSKDRSNRRQGRENEANQHQSDMPEFRSREEENAWLRENAEKSALERSCYELSMRANRIALGLSRKGAKAENNGRKLFGKSFYVGDNTFKKGAKHDGYLDIEFTPIAGQRAFSAYYIDGSPTFTFYTLQTDPYEGVYKKSKGFYYQVRAFDLSTDSILRWGLKNFYTVDQNGFIKPSNLNEQSQKEVVNPDRFEEAAMIVTSILNDLERL